MYERVSLCLYVCLFICAIRDIGLHTLSLAYLGGADTVQSPRDTCITVMEA